MLSALAFNWFHIPPTGRFEIAADNDAVALVDLRDRRSVQQLAGGDGAGSGRRSGAAAGGDRAGAGRLRELSAERDRMEAEAIEAGALRRSDELKTALLRSVSHDLRTPLTSIIAAGDGARLADADRAGAARAERGGGGARASGSRAWSRTCSTSRAWSPARREPRREPIDLVGVLEAARESLGGDGAAVKLGIDAEMPALVADPVQLERAFANLLANAVPPRRRTAGPGPLARGAAADSSFASSTRGRAFRRESGSGSSSPSTGARAAQGSGLGLAIARGFVEANGGEIAVESVPGQGSTFVVSFPLGGGRGMSERAPHPRLRRRAADRPGAAGDPPRRRLRGGAGEHAARRRSTWSPCARRRRRSST